MPSRNEKLPQNTENVGILEILYSFLVGVDSDNESQTKQVIHSYQTGHFEFRHNNCKNSIDGKNVFHEKSTTNIWFKNIVKILLQFCTVLQLQFNYTYKNCKLKYLVFLVKSIFRHISTLFWSKFLSSLIIRSEFSSAPPPSRIFSFAFSSSCFGCWNSRFFTPDLVWISSMMSSIVSSLFLSTSKTLEFGIESSNSTTCDNNKTL